MVDIDYIMNLIDWEKSPEDQRAGIELAKQVECINVFLRPCSKKYNKNVWENCAVILAGREDSQLLPYLIELFSWLQDLNWPGSEIILDRLAKMPKALTEETLKYSKSRTEKNLDEMWLVWLKEFESRQANYNC